MPYTDTTVNNLVVNVLTKSQYDSLTPSTSELYLITDDIGPDIIYYDDESSESNNGIATVELQQGKFYIFSEMTSLSVTVTNEGVYAFRFSSGITPTTLTVTGAVMPDSFSVEAGKLYEVNIYQGYGAVASWTI